VRRIDAASTRVPFCWLLVFGVRRIILHIEFQVARDAAMADRMLEYYTDIRRWRRTRRKDNSPLPDRIVQKVVYVGKAKWQPQVKIRDENLDCGFEFVDVRRLDAKRLVETGDLGDAVVAVLANDGTDANVVRAILNKIAQAPVSEGVDALAQLITLSQLRGARPLQQ
jgi:hypothetical protein